jgi:hypothetical protein
VTDANDLVNTESERAARIVCVDRDVDNPTLGDRGEERGRHALALDMQQLGTPSRRQLPKEGFV